MADDDFQQRSRSPAYPYISLLEAVKLIELFGQKHRFGKVPITIALKDMGYSATSGSGIRVLAALSQFDLFEIEGSKEARKVWLSKTGKAIVWENPSRPNERVQALRAAALNPDMHRWMYDRYNLATHPLPADEVLIYDLIHEMGFVDRGADAFVKEFKETYVYAGLDEIEAGESQSQSAVTYDPQQHSPQYQSGMPHQQLDSDVHELTTRLTKGKIARLIIPDNMNLKDFQILVRWLEMLQEADLYEDDDSAESDY